MTVNLQNHIYVFGVIKMNELLAMQVPRPIAKKITLDAVHTVQDLIKRKIGPLYDDPHEIPRKVRRSIIRAYNEAVISGLHLAENLTVLESQD